MAKANFKKISGILCDLNGTIHIGTKEIEGSIGALAKLRETGIRIHFLSNTTKESKTSLLNKLKAIGFPIESNEITTALTVSKQFCLDRGLRPLTFLSDSALQDFEEVDQTNPNCVLCGLAPSEYYYQRMNEAFRLLSNGGTLIAANKAKYYAASDGENSLGAGSFVAALEYSSGVESIIVGKPSANFFQEGLRKLGCPLDETLMIGDAYYDDVGSAMELGMRGILVKTGKYREGDENKLEHPVTQVCQNFANAAQWILENNAVNL